MSRHPLARVGDTISHGGSITTGASKTKCNGIAIARVGDHVTCSSHGAQTIATGSSTLIVEGKAAARQGDTITCGATISVGSSNTNAG
jgi:uncharacterized Zn-binding protein involved in type VI secretion